MVTASILPNGVNQFIDINGNPLVAGSVAFYEPGTLVPMDTWQDSGQTTLNTNPIILDARGQAIIYGSGIYRQRVKDQLGNLIWDALTASPYSPANPPPSVTSFYDMPIYMEGKPAAGEVYPVVNIVRDLSLPIALAGSIITISSGTLPTSSITITLYKNSSSIGTMAIDTLGNVVVTFSTEIFFVPRDQFSITWPGSQDATAANIAITLVWSVT